MVTKPDRDAFILGASWRLPVLYGLQPKTFLQDLKNDPTNNAASFSREYESEWTGTVDDAFFNGDRFDECRRVPIPEWEYSEKIGKLGYYIIAVDVARSVKKGQCQSVACVLKVLPQPEGRSIKKLVNMVVIKTMHFEDQAIELKKLYFKYKARRLIIDGNGVGAGLVDFLTVPSTLPDGSTLVDMGVYNDVDNQYKRKRTPDCELDAIYIVKANASFNTDAYTIMQMEIQSGRVHFLIGERLAQEKLLSTKIGQGMTPEERAKRINPHVLTTILKDEILNLRQSNEGINIILKQANKKITKDKFSALLYGLYYIKHEEDDRRKKKKKFDASEWCLMN